VRRDAIGRKDGDNGKKTNGFAFVVILVVIVIVVVVVVVRIFGNLDLLL